MSLLLMIIRSYIYGQFSPFFILLLLSLFLLLLLLLLLLLFTHIVEVCTGMGQSYVGQSLDWPYSSFVVHLPQCQGTTPEEYGPMSVIMLLTSMWCTDAVPLYERLNWLIVRRAGLLWSQQDFEWRWSVPLFKCLTVLEFSFILFDLCLLITFFNFIMNYVPIVTFWIFTYHKIWILSIMFGFIWSYWIIYFLACLEVSWRVVS